MKKIIFAAIALCSVLSCAKEEPVVKNEAKPIVFTAEIMSEKTTVSSKGKVDWIVGDEVTISNGNTTGIYTVKSVDDHRFASLSYKSGTKFTAKGTYTATYGDVNNQWYDELCPGSNCPMSANAKEVSLSSYKFSFKNDCGVVAVQAKTGTNKIAQIKIGNNSLFFATPKVLDGTYLVAVTPNEIFTEVAFVKNDGSKSSKTISSSSVAQNQIRDLNTGSYFSTATYSEPTALPGVFTINVGGDEVRFAKGNLWCDETASPKTYGFESNQYSAVYGQSSDHRTHFFKADYSTIYGSVDSKDNPVKGWRLLSAEEWNYLLDSRTCTNRYAKIMVNGLGGLLIFPDNYTWPLGDEKIPIKINTVNCSFWETTTNYTEDEFSSLESAGFVFLPLNGEMKTNFPNAEYQAKFNSSNKTSSITEGSSVYITSTKPASGKTASVLYFTYAQLLTKDSGSNYGYSIRLVCPVK